MESLELAPNPSRQFGAVKLGLGAQAQIGRGAACRFCSLCRFLSAAVRRPAREESRSRQEPSLYCSCRCAFSLYPYAAPSRNTPTAPYAATRNSTPLMSDACITAFSAA